MRRSLLGCLAALLFLSSGSAADTILLQDGRKLDDRLIGIVDGTCKLARGAPVPLSQVRRITLAATGAAPAGAARIHLAGGDVIHARIGQQVERGVTLASKLTGELRIGIQSVELIDFGGKGALPEEPAGREDLLYYVDKQGKLGRLKGALESIGPEQVKFVWKLSGKTYTVPLARVRALRLARVAEAPRLAELQVRLVLLDGSTLTGENLALDDKRADLHHTLDRTFAIPRTSIARIDVKSDWILLLANEQPIASSTDRLYDASKLLPLFRKNSSIWGGSLAPSTTGIGTYATTRLTYQIHGRYRRFSARVWVADISRTAGVTALEPQGEVIFRLYGDGRKLYDSGLVKVGEKPRAIDVDCSGVRRLTLEADRGPGWGVGDAANWGDPRVNK